jgi:hypothetical protein
MPTTDDCWGEGVPELDAGRPVEGGTDDPPPMKKTKAIITTAIIPTTAAMITHGFSKGSFRLLMILPNVLDDLRNVIEKSAKYFVIRRGFFHRYILPGQE